MIQYHTLQRHRFTPRRFCFLYGGLQPILFTMNFSAWATRLPLRSTPCNWKTDWEIKTLQLYKNGIYNLVSRWRNVVNCEAKMKGLFDIVITTALLGLALSHSDFASDEFIKSINEKATTWTARRNFENYTIEQLRMLAGVTSIYGKSTERLPIIVHKVRAEDIPDTFDSRNVWPECGSIGTIRNQGQCGSCWAFAAVEVMSDRLCIFSAGSKQFVFSPEELVSCCTACGSGCAGGALNEPFIYWVNNGIPSGGDEGSNYGCRPYTAGSSGETPACNERCVSGYSRSWSDDIRHGIAAFEVTSTVEQMQHEIMINGPVEAYMMVYEDFYNYGSGIYQYTSGDEVGGHAVKIIGWGTENGIPYWLVANSWGDRFGEDGFFRIIRGYNSANIETYVTAGNPNINE